MRNVVTEGNGINHQNSNLRLDCLHFTLCSCLEKNMNPSVLYPAMAR